MTIEYRISENGISIVREEGNLDFRMYTDNTFSFSFNTGMPYDNPCLSNAFLLADPAKMCVQEENGFLSFRLGNVRVSYDGSDGACTISWNGRTLKILAYRLKPKTIGRKACMEGTVCLSAAEGESFFGLGQHQTHFVDFAGKQVGVFHDYKAKGGETIGIPFLLSSRKYGVIFNSQGQIHAELGMKGRTTACYDCARDVGLVFFLGPEFEDIYTDYRQVTGITPMPLKASLGYIQSKQRYGSEQEVLGVAEEYRKRHYPLDMMVVDWFHWKVLGDLSLDRTYWPNPKAMNRRLSALHIDSMISIWPRFMRESTHFPYLEEQGWLVKDEDGQVVYGTEEDRRGALIDTTDPDCRRWLAETVFDSYGDDGFTAWWTDENEPDLWPYRYRFAEGMGYEIFNLYPYRHSQAIWEGHRKRYSHRCCILSRSAYLGSQKFGTQFWSSDIYPTWDVLQRQIPTAINFCASGMGYWSSDIGGWQTLSSLGDEETSALLMKTEGTGKAVSESEYPELYVRWFEFSVFCPVLRAHGSRETNEIWSFGPDAERILAKYLRLRYALMPYIYSQAYRMHATGYPLLRGLFLDFDDDPIARTISDEYMFGPSLLVAPVTVPSSVSRRVYLPAGTCWYDFWTNERYEGGQWTDVAAPIDTIPVFCREGSLVLLGNEVESTKERQDRIVVRSYGLQSEPFLFYHDDGVTYSYERGDCTLVVLQVIDGNLQVRGESEFNFSLELV